MQSSKTVRSIPISLTIRSMFYQLARAKDGLREPEDAMRVMAVLGILTVLVVLLLTIYGGVSRGLIEAKTLYQDETLSNREQLAVPASAAAKPNMPTDLARFVSSMDGMVKDLETAVWDASIARINYYAFVQGVQPQPDRPKAAITKPITKQEAITQIEAARARVQQLGSQLGSVKLPDDPRASWIRDSLMAAVVLSTSSLDWLIEYISQYETADFAKWKGVQMDFDIYKETQTLADTRLNIVRYALFDLETQYQP